MNDKAVQDNGNPVESLLRQIQAQLAGAKGLDKLGPAFVKAWGACSNVVKNSNNPHFGSDYADLAAVLDVVKPAFAGNGLALFQAPGPMNGDKISMINLLIHESGQTLGPITTELPIGGKMTAQAAGSAHTYARRYASQAIGGMAPVDDDGQAASEPPPKPEKPKAAKKAVKEEPEEESEGSYAEERDGLLERIKACAVSGDTTPKEANAALDGLKEEVRAMNDAEVTKAFVDQKAAIRKAAK